MLRRLLSLLIMSCFIWIGFNMNSAEAQEFSISRLPGNNTNKIEANERQSMPENRVLARVEDKFGNYVEWEEPDIEGDEPTIVINGTASELPILDPEFAEQHSAIQVFFAIAPENQEIPEQLLTYASEADLELYRDKESRRLLREQYKELYDKKYGNMKDGTQEMQNLGFFEKLIFGDAAYAQAACSNSQRNFVRRIYGEGFGNDQTCGDNSGFSQQSWPTYYCEPNNNNDCSYRLAGVNQCNPSAQSCSAFEGKLQVHRARHTGNWSDYRYNASGHSYRYMVYNCASRGASVTMWRKRGSGQWRQDPVLPLHYVVRVGGRRDPRPNARPTLGVTFGIWKQEIPKSGETYKLNRLRVIADSGTSQPIIVCGDVWKRFETFDITPLDCNFGQDFCSSGQSCEGGCWN